MTHADANLAEAEPPILLGYAGAGHPFPPASAQALVSGMSKRVRANVPAPKEEHSCQTSEMTKNDRAFIA